MKKTLQVLYIFFFIFVIFFNTNTIEKVFASPEQALFENNFAEKLLIKLQNKGYDDEVDKLYKYLDILYHENTQFYSYKLQELELLMDGYREYIIKNARNLAENNEYKKAVEYLENKSELFKDKNTINSLISHYSKFFIADGLFYCDFKPKIISINKLIANSPLAFNENTNKENLDKLYLTSKEFSNLLEELYLNDYILINLYDYIDYENENITKKDLYLPPNKKPLILIFNNINYNTCDSCFIEKFIIDANNNIMCFNSKEVEKNQVSSTTDFIPILESFVEKNKDFSYKNAKCVITFNKESGILGYDINKTNPNYNQETLNLKKLATTLKEKGYIFGYSILSNLQEAEDIEKELSYLTYEVFNIFDNLKVIFTNTNNNKILNYYYSLNSIGIKIFINLEENNNTLIKNNLALISSISVNGDFLRKQNNIINVNFEKIYDHSNRTKPFKI